MQHSPKLAVFSGVSGATSKIKEVSAHTYSRNAIPHVGVRQNNIHVESRATSATTENKSESLIARIKARRRTTPPPLTPEDREDIAETLDERSAIREFCGGLPRADAERETRKALKVFRYKLKDRPPCDPDGTGWCTAILPGFTLEAAQTHLRGIYGPNRVLTVVEHKPPARQEGAA